MRLLPCILYRVTKHFESNVQVLSEVLNQVISPAFIEIPLDLWGSWLWFGLRVDSWCLGCMGVMLLRCCRGGFLRVFSFMRHGAGNRNRNRDGKMIVMGQSVEG